MLKIMRSVKYLSFLLLFACLNITTFAAPKQTPSFSYTVALLPPFGKVTINQEIACPDPITHTARCLVQNQRVNSVMTITGLGAHVCYLTVLKNGSLKVDESRSVFCSIRSQPASRTSPGFVQLQKHF